MLNTDNQTVLSKSPLTRETTFTVVGKESVGKSQLIASLTGAFPSVENLPGSTVSVQRYRGETFTLIDTPGILGTNKGVRDKQRCQESLFSKLRT